MMTSTQNMYKNIVLNAWKEHWTEQKWTTTMRKLLQPGNSTDMHHMADVLFSQAFIGSTPKAVLLSYFNYGLKSGTLSYAAIFSAVAKHEDLHNVTNMNYTLDFLMKYIKKLNKGQILEDSITLCKALLLIVQWLLRNIEQYLRVVDGVSNADSETIIRGNCATLHSLTVLQRTSCLLTIARFEESSGWSGIETDLAVIKSLAGPHNTQSDVTMACDSISRLARCHTPTSAVYSMAKLKGNESHHSMLVNMMILLEVEWNKMTDSDTLIQQLFLIAQLCNLDAKELCLDLIRSCMMGFLGNINSKMKHKWSSVLFLSLPHYLVRFKEALSSENGSEINIPLAEARFETSVSLAFRELLQYDSLLDMLDQVTGNGDCYGWLADRCVTFGLLLQTDAENLKMERNTMPKVLAQHPTHVEPSKLVKYESTAMQLLSVLDATDYVSNQENLLSTLSQMSSKFSFILASGPVSHNVRNFAQKLILFNDAVKSSQAEGVKSAQIRCLLFDFTFFLVCEIVEQYGKNIVMGSIGDASNPNPFLYNWIRTYWPEDRTLAFGNADTDAKLEVDEARVRIYIDLLQNKRERTQEQIPSLKKWHDICTNMSKAFLEVVRARQYNVVSKADVLGSCDIICNTLSLAARLSCLIEVGRYAPTAPNDMKKDLREVFQKLLSPPNLSSPTQDLHGDKRFAMFRSSAEFLLRETNPEIFQDASISPSVSEIVEFPSDIFLRLMTECRQVGWVNSEMLSRLLSLMKRSGAKWLCHQLVSQLLGQTRKDLVERTASVIGGLLLLDVESFAICMLRHEIPHYLTDEKDHMLLSAPAGTVLAQLAVSCLAIVLHNISLQQKECLPAKTQKRRLAHQQLLSGIEAPLPRHNQAQDDGGPTKLRRLFSMTAEHDLASGAFTSILGGVRDANASQSRYPCVTEPVLRALSYALDLMHMSLTERQPGPHIDFCVYFIYLASRCGELVSQAVLKLMPLPMVTELSALITAKDSTFKITRLDKDFDSFNFTLCISDLGHQLSRKIVAKAICQMVPAPSKS